jgi:hypothetical protein
VLLAQDSGLARLGIGYDVVLIARASALQLSLRELEREAAGFAGRIAEVR